MKSQRVTYGISIFMLIVGGAITIMGIGIDRIFPTVSGYWFLIPGVILCLIGIVGIITMVCQNKWERTDIFHPFKKLFTKQHKVLSARMSHGGRGNVYGEEYLSWNFVAKLHINTTKPVTIVFKKCTAEFKHKQYKDIQSNFTDIMLIKEEYRNNKVYVYEKFHELKVSQIVIDKPSIATLLAMFTTSSWMPGDKENIEVLFKLPVSERNDRPIKISVGMSKFGQGLGFATTT